MLCLEENLIKIKILNRCNSFPACECIKQDDE
jgi:hypothetical protein